MRTTLNLDTELMREVKQCAAASGRTVSMMIETALRDMLARETHNGRAFRLRWTTVRGGAQPGVDLTDRDALYDLMEGRR